LWDIWDIWVSFNHPSEFASANEEVMQSHTSLLEDHPAPFSNTFSFEKE
jgi:hypothetical protein